MLVLSRKMNEKIRIGKDIWVEVVGIQNGKVRLGFTLPRGIPVLRHELIQNNEQRGNNANRE